MRSTIGRPRALTDTQVAAILAWHRARKSLKQVAREHGVSPGTIQNLIRCNGEYKKCSPEMRDLTLAARRRKFRQLEARGWA